MNEYSMRMAISVCVHKRDCDDDGPVVLAQGVVGCTIATNADKLGPVQPKKKNQAHHTTRKPLHHTPVAAHARNSVYRGGHLNSKGGGCTTRDDSRTAVRVPCGPGPRRMRPPHNLRLSECLCICPWSRRAGTNSRKSPCCTRPQNKTADQRHTQKRPRVGECAVRRNRGRGGRTRHACAGVWPVMAGQRTVGGNRG